MIVGVNSNTKARLLIDERIQLRADAFAELRMWQVPRAVRRSAHAFKYSLAYVVAELCVLRYDNEAGKGDHRHIGAVETPYEFPTPERVLKDFWNDVDQWRPA